MAEVVVEITFGDGTTEVDKEKLMRANGEWRITFPNVSGGRGLGPPL
jgi:hypothetical protein